MSRDQPSERPSDGLPERPPSEAMTVFLGITRLARRIRTSRSTGALSANKILVLGHLRRSGPAGPTAIAATLRQQPQSLTRVFAELEEVGLVSRSPDSRDRRQSIITITAFGDEALEDDIAEREQWLASAMAGLSETERQVLVLAARLMDRIADTAP